MTDTRWWEGLIGQEVAAVVESDRVVIVMSGAARVPLTPDGARAFAMQLIGLADRVAGTESSGPAEGRPLVWGRDGCRIEGDSAALRDGESLYLQGPAGWIRGLCVAGLAVPLLKITRGVLHLRPGFHPAGEPTLVRRASDS